MLFRLFPSAPTFSCQCKNSVKFMPINKIPQDLTEIPEKLLKGPLMIKENLGTGTRVNILAQYRPCWKAMKYNDIKRPISPEEYRDVVAYAKRIGLINLV